MFVKQHQVNVIDVDSSLYLLTETNKLHTALIKACHGQRKKCIQSTFNLTETFPFAETSATVMTLVSTIIEKQTGTKGVEKHICYTMKLDGKVVQQI